MLQNVGLLSEINHLIKEQHSLMKNIEVMQNAQQGLTGGVGPGDSIQLAFARTLAHRRRMHLPTSWQTAADLDWSVLMPPSYVDNLCRYREAYANKHQGLGAFYCDLEQNSGQKGENGAREMGAFLTHGTGWSMTCNFIKS